MKLLMIGHLLGDFYFQTDKFAEKKRTSLKYTFLHSLIYSLVIFAVALLDLPAEKKTLQLIVIIGLSHFVVDGIKTLIHRKATIEKHKLLIFVLDQIIHIAILYGVNNWYGIGITDMMVEGFSILTIICACLICGKPSAIIVSLIFEKIPKTICNAENDNPKNNEEKTKIGSWIGILEREIILVLGLFGEYGAIGFVVAAKSVARHRQLDNEAFAEKYLVGTLVSSLIALGCIAMCIIV